MLNDLMPIVVDLPAKDCTLYPLGDLHAGSKQFSDKAFRDWKKTVLEDETGRVVICGDLFENATKNSVGDVYESMSPSATLEYLYNEFKDGLDERIICMTSGNHEKRSKRETDTDLLYMLAIKLKCEHLYRPSACFCFLRVNYRKDGNIKTAGKHRPTYAMLVTHGAGGGQYIGSGLNKVERFGTVVDGLDLMITGHTHKPACLPAIGKLQMDFRNKQVIQKQFVSVVCSSFMDYNGGYALDKMLVPSGQAMQKIILSHYKKGITVVQST